MKLVNKTITNIKVFGEIVPCNEYGCIAVKTERGVTWYYRSLAELSEEWEDYEEPKKFFTIYYDGTISEFKDGDDDQIRDMKAIGNYFVTKEEAEKAVEKLKAWKRLKDKGFKFDNFVRNAIYYKLSDEEIEKDNVLEDLDLLFGGEE